MTLTAELPHGWVGRGANSRSMKTVHRPTNSGTFQYEISYSGQQFVASEPVTAMYGVGDDVQEAMNDLYSTLRSYRRSLARGRDELGSHLLAHLEYLERPRL